MAAVAEPGRLPAALLAALLVAASPALASPCLEEAGALHSQGRDEEALARLQSCPGTPARTFLLGHVLWKLRRHSEALTQFRRYLPDAKPAERENLRRLIEELDLLLRTVLAVRSSPPGAAVFLDDPLAPQLGVTPLVTGVRPGEHVIYFRKDGHRDQQLTVVAEVGKQVEASVVLTPLPATPASAPSSPAPALAAPAALPPGATAPRRPTWPLLLGLGLAVTAGGAALGSGLAARSARSEFDDTGRCSLRDTIRDRAIAADVMIGVGAAAAVVTAALYLVWYRRPAGVDHPPRGPGSGLRGLVVSF